MVGLNPEVGHEQMAGLNFVHGIAQALWHGKLFHIDLNGQHGPSTTRTWSSATATCSSAFFLVDLLERHGGATTGPRHFDYKPLRTEDPDDVWVAAAANMRTYLLLKRARPAFRADPEVQAALAAAGSPSCPPTLAAGRDLRDLLADRTPSRTSTEAAGRAACTTPPRPARVEHLLGARHDLVAGVDSSTQACKVVVRDADTARWSARAGRPTRTAPRSTPRLVGGPARRRRGRRRPRRRRPRSRSAPSSTAWSAWTRTARSSARRCCGTTPARRRPPPS
jgi:hypothetical protein